MRIWRMSAEGCSGGSAQGTRRVVDASHMAVTGAGVCRSAHNQHADLPFVELSGTGLPAVDQS